MGIGSSRRRAHRMSGDGATPPQHAQEGGDQNQEDGNEDQEPDLTTILSYLIRSGQVRILSSGSRMFGGGIHDDDDDDDEDYIDEWTQPAEKPNEDPNPDTSAIDMSALKDEILLKSGQMSPAGRGVKPSSLAQMLQRREAGVNKRQQFSAGECCHISNNYLPNKMEQVARYCHKAFCGTFSASGDVFLSACQDQNIRLYDTKQNKFEEFKTIRARDVGWSIIDTAFSPDGNYLIYSSWSDYIHLCNIYGDYKVHTALPVNPDGVRFCIFSLTFSVDNKEILGGASDGNLYVCDRELNERILKIDAHEDDVNAVAFADNSSNILYSGADDGLVKVWDRRTLREHDPQPVGNLAGHYDGITFIDSKGDARYLISNSKDQTIKLWDIRKFSSSAGLQATRREVTRQRWDYRWQQVPKKVCSRRKKLEGDTSLMTYRGHSILHTLVRCRFSPEFTTAQRYIYTGCATGAVVIYDILTGQIVTRLSGHRSCVRDVDWHPYEPRIVSSSWDGTVGVWQYSTSQDSEDDSDDSWTDEDDDRPGLRRSKRLRCQRERQRQEQPRGMRRLLRLF